MAAWVLESAFRYAKAAAVLSQAGNFAGESEVNAALAMELMFKSLLVVPVTNNRSGTVAQQYTMPRGLNIGDGHDLFKLYGAIPQNVADRLGLTSQKDLFERKRDVFKQARYCYEVTAPRGYDTVLLGTVSWLLPQFVCHFVEQGHTDPWLLYMAENPERMQMHMLSDPLK